MVANKEQLVGLYSEGLKSTGKIASIFNTILRWMLNFDIPRRSRTEAKECNSFAKKLEDKIGGPRFLKIINKYIHTSMYYKAGRYAWHSGF